MRTSLSPTRSVRALVAAAFVASAATVSIPASAQAIPANAKYSCSFENGYCDFSEQSKIGSISPTSGSARRSSLVSTSRVGGQGVRLQTLPGDHSVNGSGEWERNDLQKPADSSYCNEGQEEWWAVSVLFPSDYVMPASGQGGVIVDFHHTGSSGVPNFGVEVRGESGMRISGYGGSVNNGQYRAQIADPWGAVNNVTRNVWYDFVFHIKWSAGGGGFAEAWLNGKKVLAHTGATLYSGQSCYLKLANYHAASGKASATIFDRVVRGTSAADVAITALEGVNGFFAPSTPAAPTTPSAPVAGTGSSGGSGTQGSTGKASTSATMDSSAYTIAAGQSVTFTARVMGNGATPGGTIGFNANGNAIAGCGAVAVSGGVARCTTSALSGGQHKITGAYSGDASYASATAGPITQTVTGGVVPLSLPAKFGMDSSSYSVGAGDNVTFTASIPGSGGTVRFMANGSTIAACSAVTVSSSGIANCSATLPAGSHAITGAYSGNGSYRAGTAGPITQTVNAKSASTPAASGSHNVQGLWWGGAGESGWGVNLAQQGGIVFATWFTYDAQGNASWLVMSDGRATGANSYAGTVYRTSGPGLAKSFDPSQVTRAEVGSAWFNFSDADNGTFTAVVDGVQVTKSITRQVFDARVPRCTAGGNANASRNFQDLWWRVGGVESGWGMNLTHQGDKLFLTWFTYGDDGAPLWLVASDVSRQADGSYAGTLYRTTGTALTRSWNPGNASVTPVGSVRFSFSDGANGTFAYTVNGMSGSKPIARQVFSTPATVCNPS